MIKYEKKKKKLVHSDFGFVVKIKRYTLPVRNWTFMHIYLPIFRFQNNTKVIQLLNMNFDAKMGNMLWKMF